MHVVQFACAALLVLGAGTAANAQGPDLTNTKWRMAGDPLNRTFSFLQGKPGSPVRFTQEHGQGDAYTTQEWYDRHGYDGTYDGKHLALKGRGVNSLIRETLTLNLNLSSDSTHLTGTEIHYYGDRSRESESAPEEFIRLGAPSTGTVSAVDLPPYLKRVLGLVIGVLVLILMLKQLTAPRDSGGGQSTDYLLHVRTVDERATLNADGKDVLWVYAMALCTNPAVDSMALTSSLNFTPQGPNASWLVMDQPQMVEGFKVVPVRAWPPEPDRQLLPEGPMVVASAVVPGNVLSGSVPVSIKPAPNLEVLDASCAFDNGSYPDTAIVDLQGLAAEPHTEARRIGAAADGVSLLLLRLKLALDGQATFRLEGADAGGTLHQLSVNPWGEAGVSTLEVSPVVIKGEKWSFALYRPPRDFCARYTDRQFQVTVTFRTTDGTSVQTAEATVKLVRPPLVLVHGTYDDPVSCWQKPMNSSVAPLYKTTMESFLKGLGLHEIRGREIAVVGGGGFSMVDWREISGMTDPSGFGNDPDGFGRYNWKTVWDHPSGIKEALDAYRGKGIAATQADLVCHSLGGLIARVYARGIGMDTTPAQEHLVNDADHLHLKEPYRCTGCWYHRPDNFCRGDIHKLITISTTHMGSDLPRLLAALIEYRETPWRPDMAAWMGLVLDKINEGNAIYTQAFKDQIPGCEALRRIGATVVPAHAIACVAEENDLPTVENGYYENRMSQAWLSTSREAVQWAFERLGQPNDASRLAQMKPNDPVPVSSVLPVFSKVVNALETKSLFHCAAFREAAFGHSRNDCTVREESSLGGLKGTCTSVAKNVLHGYASRYEKVQLEVQRLLDAPIEGPDFCLAGFPDAFAPDGAWESGPGRTGANDGPGK